MIEIEIDGKTIQAKEGAMVIQAADEAGIYIPRFCYHKKLTIAANCRMCLVEIEKAPKTLPACATPVSPGMKVFTQSEKTIASQTAVMEFLLINHPLDCPICDQGGECELQDLAMGFGKGISRYNQGKRSVKDKNLGPLISSDMTRCIQCTRCVRFGNEIAGMPELGTANRGDALEITTYIEKAIASEISGNIIDVCPVGALTSKPFRFTARAWELTQHPAIALHDCMGANTYIHSRGQEYSPVRPIMRVVPRENEGINEVWLADRDRFSYTALDSPTRITKPMIKRQNRWQEVDWDVAFDECVDSIRNCLRRSGAEQIAALISPSASVEECYLLQKTLRSLGCNNIDHRLRHTDFSHQMQAPLAPVSDFSWAELERADTVLLIGSDIRREQPLANARLRKAAIKGAKVIAINPIAYDYNFAIEAQCLVAGIDFVKVLLKLLKALSEQSSVEIPEEVARVLATVKAGKAEAAIADKLFTGQNVVVILGAYALQHMDAANVYAIAKALTLLTPAKLLLMTEGANAAGAWLAGAVPHRQEAGKSVEGKGMNAREMFAHPRQVYLLYGVEPELDSANAAEAMRSLQAAESVIAFSAHRSKAMEEYATIILPIAALGENPGSWVNAQGLWQSMEAVSVPQGEARQGWQVLQELRQRLEVPDVNFLSWQEISAKLTTELSSIPDNQIANWPKLTWTNKRNANLRRISLWPMYRIDSIVRHAPPLQAHMAAEEKTIRINSQLAQELNLIDGAMVTAVQEDSRVSLPLMIDDGVADYNVVIPAGLDETAGFGDATAKVELFAE